MTPWVLLGQAEVPGGGRLRLMQRGSEFSIMMETNELMNSRLSGSEEALAKLACLMIQERRAPRVLIGGLGMGFTLRAALANLGPDASVLVSELLPDVVAWARGPMGDLFEGCLEDPRVAVRESDVAEVIRSATALFDAILLDVDNGPEGLTRPANNDLYGMPGLAAARQALVAGGVLAVWSSKPDWRFTERLRRTGFRVEEKRVRAHRKGSGARHMIWLATRD